MIHKSWFYLGFILNLGDTVGTHLYHHSEGNPFLIYLFNTIGVIPALTLKLVLVSLIIYLIYKSKYEILIYPIILILGLMILQLIRLTLYLTLKG